MRSPGDRARFGVLILTALTLYSAANAVADRRRPEAAAAPAPASWWKLPAEMWQELGASNISMMAAGVAFYALLAIIPGLSALVSLYGLVADPTAVQKLLVSLAGVLPAEAVKLLADQLQSLIHAAPAKLGLGLLVSLALAVWSAMSGTTMLMQALTAACDEKEERGLLNFYGTAAVLTFGLILAGVVSLLLVAVIPAVLDRLPFPDSWREMISFVRWPILAALAIAALGLVYRYAPNRCGPGWGWINPGAIVATLFWVLASAGFSFYVARFGSYDKTYGSLGAVVVLLMWFYLTAYIILAGAKLNTVLAARRKSAP
jgi:membrane protein